MFVHSIPTLPLPVAHSAALVAPAAAMSTIVLPASAAALSSSSFGVASHPAAVLPLSVSPALSSTSTVTLSPSLIHRPIPIAATPRASLLTVAAPNVSIPSTHSAFSTAAANSAFSPALHPQQSPAHPPPPPHHHLAQQQQQQQSMMRDTSPKQSALLSSPSGSEHPPSYSRPSSTSSTTDAASPSMSHKSIASTASPLSTTRHQRQSSLSSNASSASPSHHRGSLSSDGGSSSDLLGMSRAESGKDAMVVEAQQDVSPVEEDDEDRPSNDDSADDDEAALASTTAIATSVKDEDAPAPHMTAGLSPAQLAAVHKGTSCHQCKNTKQLKKLAFCANLFNKRTKPEKRVCRKKYCETSINTHRTTHDEDTAHTTAILPSNNSH